MSGEKRNEVRPVQQLDPQSPKTTSDIVPLPPTPPATIGLPPLPPSLIQPSSDVPSLEKLKYYTDLYKFNFELPLKIFSAYSSAATLTLATAAYFTRDLNVILWMSVFIAFIGAISGLKLHRSVGESLDEAKKEVDSLLNELDFRLGPNFQMMKFVTKYMVVLFIGLPFALALILYFFFVK